MRNRKYGRDRKEGKCKEKNAPNENIGRRRRQRALTLCPTALMIVAVAVVTKWSSSAHYLTAADGEKNRLWVCGGCVTMTSSSHSPVRKRSRTQQQARTRFVGAPCIQERVVARDKASKKSKVTKKNNNNNNNNHNNKEV